MPFNPAFKSLIPRAAGSNANDWVTRTIVAPVSPSTWMPRPSGQDRTYSLRLKIAVSSGSGSNSWTIEPVYVRNHDEASDNWELWTPPPISAVNVCSIMLADTELPYDRLFEVPRRLDRLAFKFTRSGAGSLVLAVDAFANFSA